MRRNGYLGTSSKNTTSPFAPATSISYKTSVFHYRVTLTGYIWCFCATTSHDLVTLDFDLLNLRVCHVQYFSFPTHIPVFIILRLSVTELRVLNNWSHFRYLKLSKRMRRVTWPLTEGKNSLHFWNPWPQFAYSLSHSHGATTNSNPCYRQKIAISHYEGYKVYCACAVSRDLCIGGPPKPHLIIFWPRIAYSLYNFYAATMTIKGSFILEHPYVKAVFGRIAVKIGPEMAVFRKFKGPNVKFSHRDPQKALLYPERRHLTYFA